MRLDEESRRDQLMGELSGGSAPGSNNSIWWIRRAGVFSAARLALSRASHTRWLLLVVALGILVADILISTVPLYNTIVPDIQLHNALSRANSLQNNMQIIVSTSAVDQAHSAEIAREVRDVADSYLTPFSVPHPTTYLTSRLLSLDQVGTHKFGGFKNNAQARLQAFDYAALRPYLHMVQGTPPQAAQASQPAAGDQPIPVMITHEMADDWHVSVGQPVLLSVQRTQFASGTFTTVIKGTITGIFEPVNANDPFWNGLTFNNPSAFVESLDYVPPIYPVLTTYDNFFSSLAHDSASIGGVMTQTWVYYANPDRITTENMADIANNIAAFRSQITTGLQSSLNNDGNAQPGSINVNRGSLQMLGGLDQIIQGVQQQLSLIALPLYVIAAQVVGLALLFVAAMAALLIEQQSAEIVTLKSRGASGVQMLGIFTTQSAALGLLAAIISPFLALGLALLLIRWFLPGSAIVSSATASGGSAAVSASLTSYITRVASPSLVLVPALIGAVLAIAVVTASALRTAQLDVLAFRRELARPTRKPLWHRAYLDVGLALLCLVGYLELAQFGGANVRVELGSQSNSPLLLITPALLLLAGGLLLLRLIPLAAHLGSRLASRGRGLTALLAFTQIERAPNRYARMILLIVLAVGLGLFALTFDASVVKNVQDRTAYAVGADVRLNTSLPISVKVVNPYMARLKTLPGVMAATPLYRTGGRTSDNLGDQPVELLGIDTPTFAGAANPRSWRADYAAQSLPALMRELAPSSGSDPKVIGTSAHPLAALVSETFAEQLRLTVGKPFQLAIPDIVESSPMFVVAAIVQEFPTLYPTRAPGGFVVVNLGDLEATIAAQGSGITLIGPNEFWLRTSGSTSNATRQALDRQRFDLSLNTVESYQQDLRQAQDNPMTGGIRGLLLIGAVTAVLLAVLGSLAQTVLAARQRTRQFAIFRTIGMGNGQLGRILLGEQVVVYLFGLLGGTSLGLLLTTATSPYLTFSDTAVDVAAVGVPGYVLEINWLAICVFYGALLVAFLLALAITARYAATIGLGKALRLGED